jgi:hypothetical protein
MNLNHENEIPQSNEVWKELIINLEWKLLSIGS